MSNIFPFQVSLRSCGLNYNIPRRTCPCKAPVPRPVYCSVYCPVYCSAYCSVDCTHPPGEWCLRSLPRFEIHFPIALGRKLCGKKLSVLRLAFPPLPAWRYWYRLFSRPPPTLSRRHIRVKWSGDLTGWLRLVSQWDIGGPPFSLLIQLRLTSHPTTLKTVLGELEQELFRYSRDMKTVTLFF